jgi:hypothetical protein
LYIGSPTYSVWQFGMSGMHSDTAHLLKPEKDGNFRESNIAERILRWVNDMPFQFLASERSICPLFDPKSLSLVRFIEPKDLTPWVFAAIARSEQDLGN